VLERAPGRTVAVSGLQLAQKATPSAVREEKTTAAAHVH
jgi:hypothetical protein